jgi:hypothetical protein
MQNLISIPFIVSITILILSLIIRVFLIAIYSYAVGVDSKLDFGKMFYEVFLNRTNRFRVVSYIENNSKIGQLYNTLVRSHYILLILGFLLLSVVVLLEGKLF